MQVDSASHYEDDYWGKLFQRACFDRQHPEERVILQDQPEATAPVRFRDLLPVMATR